MTNEERKSANQRIADMLRLPTSDGDHELEEAMKQIASQMDQLPESSPAVKSILFQDNEITMKHIDES